MTTPTASPSRSALDPSLPWPFDRGEPETEQDVIDRIEESPL